MLAPEYLCEKLRGAGRFQPAVLMVRRAESTARPARPEVIAVIEGQAASQLRNVNLSGNSNSGKNQLLRCTAVACASVCGFLSCSFQANLTLRLDCLHGCLKRWRRESFLGVC